MDQYSARNVLRPVSNTAHAMRRLEEMISAYNWGNTMPGSAANTPGATPERNLPMPFNPTPIVGRHVERDRGYVRLLRSDGTYVYEHRFVMARHLGRDLTPDEVVHHINGNTSDNRIDNLRLMNQSEHISLHATDMWATGRLRPQSRPRLAEGQWSFAHASCIACGTTHRPHMAGGKCRRCYLRDYQRERRGSVVLYEWSRRHAHCVRCGTTARKHVGKGLCQQCYDAVRHATRSSSKDSMRS